MKTIQNLVIICLSLVMMSYRCVRPSDNAHLTITFINKSDQKLYLRIMDDYPDTLSYRNERDPTIWKDDIVWPKEVNTGALYNRYSYEHIFNFEIPSGVMMIYVFDAHVLENHPWDSLKMGNPVIKRYDLTLQDLRDLDWTIVYP